MGKLRKRIGIHKYDGLLRFGVRLFRKERDGHSEKEVQEHAPEQGVAPAVESFKTEERRGVQERRVENRRHQAAWFDDSRAHKRGDEQGVDPDAEPGDDPRDRALLVPPLPVEAEQNGRREDRDRLERLETDVNKAVEIADVHGENISEEHTPEDHEPLDVQDDRGKVLYRAQVPEGRHHEAVHHHGAEGNGLDDDHGRGRRKTADEGNEREKGIALGKRYAEDEVVRVRLRASEKQSAVRDREHEDIDKEQVERKEPHGLLDMTGRVVLDHGDVKLPGQEHDGHHRQKGERRPLEKAHRGPLSEPRERGKAGHLELSEDIAEAAEYPVGDKEPDKEKGDEFDRRFKGNGKHEAAVPLRGVKPSRAEDDREHAEHQRNEPAREVAALGSSGKKGEGRHDGLELEPEVRGDADDRNDGDEGREREGLAVPRSDEIRDRRDPVLFRQKDDLPEDDPPEGGHERRADIGREEAQARVRRLSHAAVERPRGAVHGEREGIDVGIRYQALPLPLFPFSQIGHGKKKKKVGEYDKQQYPGRKHLLFVLVSF